MAWSWSPLVVLSASLCSAVVLDGSAAATIQAGSVHVERGFAPSRLVQDLREDIDACVSVGLFAAAGSGGRNGEEDTLRSAAYCDRVGSDRTIGIWGAFEALWERLDMVRLELGAALGCELLPEMELHYVRYPAGGFYKRHVDDFLEDTSDPSRTCRRCVSFICYLNEPGWEEIDGGQLRARNGPDAQTELLPESGNLVLFDSLKLEHEVLPTRRTRTCLIGWFHTPV